MLGFALHRVLTDAGLDVIGTTRGKSSPSSDWCNGLKYLTGVDVSNDAVVRDTLESSMSDIVINAVGATTLGSAGVDERTMLAINGVFPRHLDLLASELGKYLIHFSTDGVFSGRRGGYDEQTTADATDVYGMSKFLGEPTDGQSLILRTSLLGRSLGGGNSLVDWLMCRSGKVRGYQRAVFSGLPVNEVATMLLGRVLSNRKRLTGTFHVSSAPISKYDLLKLACCEWGLSAEDIVADDSVVIDRSLDSSKFREATGYVAPKWPELIRGMHKFYSNLVKGSG
jgi:dTDP-4-dehydrorhamnose reductase